MRRSVQSLVFLVVILIAAGVAAGCGSAGSSAGSTIKSAGSTVKSAISGLSSHSATAPAPTRASAPTASAPTASAPTTAASRAIATSPAASAPAAAASPAGSGSGTSLVWLWILLGALVVAGLIVWITRAVRRGSAAAAADRRFRLVDAYSKGSALHDAMTVAEMPGAMTTDDAGARWADIQRRADELAQTLYALREQVPRPEDKVRIADALASLQAVRSAMAAERAPGGAGPRQAEVVRNRLDAFESSLRALRSPGGSGRTPTPDRALGAQPGRAHRDEQDDVQQELEH